MEVQICGQCNWPMEDSNYNLCWTCWRENQGYKRIKSDDRYDDLQKIIHGLLEECNTANKNHQGWSTHYQEKIKTLEAQINQLKMQLSHMRFEQEQGKIKPDQDLIKRLIMFCHPDKNQGREEEASEITKMLLALRDKK